MNSARLGLLAVLVLAACEQPTAVTGGNSTGIRFLAEGASDGFARALTARPFVFPQDHGSHPEYRTEWWYFTGNLFSAESRHYGFELTFFRIALNPVAIQRASAWGANQVWMGHFALTDTANGRFSAAERLSRGALGLAGANATPLRVWVEDWHVAEDNAGTLRLAATMPEGALDLELKALKAPVPQGIDGLDPKGPEAGNASYYYSVPRLAASGTVRTADETSEAVQGLAWMDREWGTSALSPGVAGWDWFALQLSDGRDLMFYRLRGRDGSTSPFSGGTLIGADGERRVLAADDVALEVRRWWTSPASRARYPVAWRLVLGEISLDIEPVLPQQELDLSVRYWEGAVKIEGGEGALSLTGNGYLELAGY